MSRPGKSPFVKFVLSLNYAPGFVHFMNNDRKKFFLYDNGNAGNAGIIPKYSRGRRTSPCKASTAVLNRGAVNNKGKKWSVFKGISGRLAALKKVSKICKKVLTDWVHGAIIIDVGRQ